VHSEGMVCCAGIWLRYFEESFSRHLYGSHNGCFVPLSFGPHIVNFFNLSLRGCHSSISNLLEVLIDTYVTCCGVHV